VGAGGCHPEDKGQYVLERILVMAQMPGTATAGTRPTAEGQRRPRVTSGGRGPSPD